MIPTALPKISLRAMFLFWSKKWVKKISWHGIDPIFGLHGHSGQSLSPSLQQGIQNHPFWNPVLKKQKTNKQEEKKGGGGAF